MKKYSSLDELTKERETLEDKFENGLPDYLVEFFDRKEKRFNITDTVDKMQERGATSEEIAAYRWSLRRVKIEPEEPEKDSSPIKNIDIEEQSLSVDEIEVLKEVCKYDIYAFAVRYFSHYLKRRSSKLHRYLYKLLNRKIVSKRKDKSFKIAIAAPRSNAKSSVISLIFPLWCLCFDKKKYIIMLSDTGGKAEGFLEDIKRELIHNEKLVRDFPDVCGKGSMWRVDEIITNNDIKIKATGTGSNIRGERYGMYRPDLVIGDDLENSEMVRSKTKREHIRYDWFNKDVLYVGGEAGTQTDFFVIGTILGKDSLLNALLDAEQYPAWESRRFAAVIKFPESDKWEEWESIYKNRLNANRQEDALAFFEEHTQEMEEGAEVLWPDGDPIYNLMVEKISDPSGFISEKQNDPIDPSKVLVLEEELSFLDFHHGIVHEAISTNRVDYFSALDPSLGKGKDSDFSCIVTIARDRKTGYLFVVDIDLKRRSTDEQIATLLKKFTKYKQKNIAIETNAFQIVLADNLRKASRKEGFYLPITDIQNYSDKHMRIQSLVPLLKDGTIIFDKYQYRTNQMYNNGIEMLTTYTEGASHDDFPDALEICVRICRQKKFHLITKVNN